MITSRSTALTRLPDSLNKEILAAAEWISPTPEEQQVRDRAIQRVRESIISRWSRAQVYVFGSHETQLYLPGG